MRTTHLLVITLITAAIVAGVPAFYSPMQHMYVGLVAGSALFLTVTGLVRWLQIEAHALQPANQAA